MSAVRRIVGVGASAGGIEALIRLVRGLPADLPAAVLVVLHIPPTGRSVLPLILGRQSPVPVVAAEDGAPVRAGCVMVAPPDCHLLVADGRIRLERGPKENGVRPAVDRERPGGSPTGFTCPDCGGALWAIPDPSRRPRYRCRSGHQYSEDTLLGQQAERVEAAPWTALDVLAELLERSRGAADAMRRAELLRDALAAAAHAPDALDVDAGDLAG